MIRQRMMTRQGRTANTPPERHSQQQRIPFCHQFYGAVCRRRHIFLFPGGILLDAVSLYKQRCTETVQQSQHTTANTKQKKLIFSKMMSQQKFVLITLFGLVALLALIDAIGLPQQNQCCQQQQQCCQPQGGCCCSGGGGGGLGGLGRRRRRGAKEIGQVASAVQPHYKAVETPCPQMAWQEILEKSILPGDAVGSVSAIQSGLYARFGQKFLVTCADANETKDGSAVANRVHFSSSGDGYCNMVKEKVWCQAVAVVA